MAKLFTCSDGGNVRRVQTFRNINVVPYHPTLPLHYTPHFPTIGIENILHSFFPNGTTVTTIKKKILDFSFLLKDIPCFINFIRKNKKDKKVK